MATTSERIIQLAQAIGPDIKALREATGDLSQLQTFAGDSLVSAVNEIFLLAQSGGANAGAGIDDNATSGDLDSTWSADKIFDEIAVARASLRTELTAGAGAALDTFNELAAALDGDASFAATIATALGNRVKFDAVQMLTGEQKLRACENIGVGDPNTDFVALYIAAKA